MITLAVTLYRDNNTLNVPVRRYYEKNEPPVIGFMFIRESVLYHMTGNPKGPEQLHVSIRIENETTPPDATDITDKVNENPSPAA